MFDLCKTRGCGVGVGVGVGVVGLDFSFLGVQVGGLNVIF